MYGGYQSGLRKGRALQPGDLIGIISPAGPVDESKLQVGIERLHELGYRTLLGHAAASRWRYLAGTDAERAADLNAMWGNPAVAGIICARGGYGAMRILEMIDWYTVAANPKFFTGFSDITALHIAMRQRAGLVTFHGPMVAAFGAAERYNRQQLMRAMGSSTPLGLLPWPDPEGPQPPTPLVIRAGTAVGPVVGGNLTLLSALLGTPYEPDLAGAILLVEEVDEAPYRVDRLIQQLLLGGKLQGVAGILFGDSPSCMYGPNDKSYSLLDVLADRLGPLGVPVLYGFPCGHGEYRATVPLGVMASLDASAGTFTVLESALH